MLMVRRRLRSGQEGNGPQGSFFTKFGGQTVENSSASGREGGWRFRRLLSERVYNGRVPFTIRDAKPEDFEILWSMDQECFAPGIAYSREELKVYMRRRGAFTLLAVGDDGAIAGFIVVHGGPAGHVITIDVIEAVRRSGVGSKLLQAAEERLRGTGSRAVGLETAVDNLSALSFYKRHGYSVIKTWPRYYSNGVDALVLKKELTPSR
jgi:[ribosomal protein S18]-alanine N-acetyltransferase